MLPKIREVDKFLSLDIARQGRIREVHSELSFWAWNEQVAINESKKTKNGLAARKLLVANHFGPSAFESVRSQFMKKQVADDHICDAFAALWTAERIAKGEALVTPASPSVDRIELRMEMWY